MDAIVRSPNRLLGNLSPDNFDLLASHLRTIELVHGAELVGAGDDLVDAYFPHSGVISLVVRFVAGHTTEVATVGRECLRGIGGAWWPHGAEHGRRPIAGRMFGHSNKVASGSCGAKQDLPNDTWATRAGELRSSAAIYRVFGFASRARPFRKLALARPGRHRYRRTAIHPGVSCANAGGETKRRVARLHRPSGCRAHSRRSWPHRDP